ncbi:MAG: shikimate dehydrogenase [Planctomycetota bacterium]|nr:MAG: shikimate dehydrogenase [Planctomycetota bacterium]
MTHPAIQEIVAVFGQPVAGNPTQYMMEKAFADVGLEWRYLTLEVAPEALGDAVRGMRAMGFRGCNLTIPHKVEVIQHLDGTSEAATLMGAVNCVNRIDGKLIGDNTDGKGFVQSLRELTDPAGKNVIILGAGGAARAIAVEVALAGAAAMTIVNRTEGRGQELAALINDKANVPTQFVLWEGDYEVPPEAEVVINATSIGLGDAAARVPLAVDSLESDMVVADVVFNPPETRLLRDAKSRGCETLDGLGMLVNQAVIGFNIWTGRDANPSVMREALEEFLGF